MDGTAFLRLGHYLWTLHNVIDFSIMGRPEKKEDLTIIKGQIDLNYRNLEQYILERGIIPPMSQAKGQAPNPDVLQILSFIGYGQTQPDRYISSHMIAKTLSVLEEDEVAAIIRVQGVVNELLERGFLVFKDEDNYIELSGKIKILVTGNNPSVLGLSKDEIALRQARRKTRQVAQTPEIKQVPSLTAREMNRIVSQLMEEIVFSGAKGKVEIQASDVRTFCNSPEPEPAHKFQGKPADQFEEADACSVCGS